MRQITVPELKTLYEDSELILVQVTAVQIADPEEEGAIAYIVGLRALFQGDPTLRSIGLVAGGDRSRAPGPKIYRRFDFVLSSIHSIFHEKTYNLTLWLRTAEITEPIEMFIREFQLDEKAFGPSEKVRRLILDALRSEGPTIARNRDTADA